MAHPFEEMVLVPKDGKQQSGGAAAKKTVRRRGKKPALQDAVSSIDAATKLRLGASVTKPRVHRRRAPKGFTFSAEDLDSEELQKRMTDVLQRSGMLDLEKWQIYHQLAMHDLRRKREEAKTPKVKHPESHGALTKSLKSETDIMNDITGMVTSAHKRTSARKLLTFLASAPADTFRWDRYGRIVIRGRTIQNSNISELVADTVRSVPAGQEQASIPGWEQFKNIILEMGIPRSLVTNKTRYYTAEDFKDAQWRVAAAKERDTGIAAKQTRTGNIYGSGGKRGVVQSGTGKTVRWFKCHPLPQRQVKLTSRK